MAQDLKKVGKIAMWEHKKGGEKFENQECGLCGVELENLKHIWIT